MKMQGLQGLCGYAYDQYASIVMEFPKQEPRPMQVPHQSIPISIALWVKYAVFQLISS